MEKLYLIEYEITGYNVSYLITSLKRNGVSIYNVKKKDKKRTLLSVEKKEVYNFFAITKNMCYNVKCVREYGLPYLLKTAVKNVGIIIGAVIFVITQVIVSNTFFKIDFYGTGAVYMDSAQEVLTSNGITPFSFITAETLKNAENEVIKNCDKFSFVSIKKDGMHIRVNLILSPTATEVVDTSRKNIVSPVTGEIESIKVLRGTAQYKVGDTVKAGAILIFGYNIVKEKCVYTYPLGITTVICTEVDNYEVNDKETAITFSREKYYGKEIISESVEETETGFTVTVKYRVKIK